MKIYWAPRRPLSTAIIHFRDKRLILQVDNARSYSDIVLPSALFCSTKRHCLTEAYICAVTVTLRKNHSSSLRLPPPLLHEAKIRTRTRKTIARDRKRVERYE